MMVQFVSSLDIVDEFNRLADKSSALAETVSRLAAKRGFDHPSVKRLWAQRERASQRMRLLYHRAGLARLATPRGDLPR